MSFYKNLLNKVFRDAQRNNLLDALKKLLPVTPASVLDIGAGDGAFSAMLAERMPNLTVHAIDVMKREAEYMPVEIYDGGRIPHNDGSFDYALLMNCLHHTNDAASLLGEALRVSRKGVIIKDHYANTMLDKFILTAMEYANPNSRMLMSMPLNFYSKKQWQSLFADMNVVCDEVMEDFPSYSAFWDIFFGRNMHFIARCRYGS